MKQELLKLKKNYMPRITGPFVFGLLSPKLAKSQYLSLSLPAAHTSIMNCRVRDQWLHERAHLLVVVNTGKARSLLIVLVVVFSVRLLQGLQLMTTVSQPVYDLKNDTVTPAHRSSARLQCINSWSVLQHSCSERFKRFVFSIKTHYFRRINFIFNFI